MAVYYVICDDDCRYEGMTKEQILTAIEQALKNGHISDPDGAVISRLKEINKGGAARVWVGTEAEYNALSPAPTAQKLAVRMGADGVLYVCTDDSTLADYEKHTQDKENPHEVTLEHVLGGVNEATAKKARDTIGAASRDDFDALQIGGRNLLQNSEYYVDVTTENKANIYKSFGVDAAYLPNLIGQTITASMFVNAVGECADIDSTTVSGEKNRIGYTMYPKWGDSTGVNADTIEYNDNIVANNISNQRIANTITLKPPKGYDTLKSIRLMLCATIRPTDADAVWRLGYPQIEIGNRATDWTPAPEDKASVAHKHTAADVGAVDKNGDTMAGALGFSTAELGKQTLKNMGIEIQRGTVEKASTVNMTIVFNEPFSGVPTVVASSGSGNSSVRARDITETGFVLSSGVDGNEKVQWIAIYTAF